MELKSYIEKQQEARIAEARLVNWRSVSCPYCHADIGENCSNLRETTGNYDRNIEPHPSRVRVLTDRAKAEVRAQWCLREQTHKQEGHEHNAAQERRMAKTQKPKTGPKVSDTYQIRWQVTWTHGRQPTIDPEEGYEAVGEWFPFHGSEKRICWRRPMKEES